MPRNTSPNFLVTVLLDGELFLVHETASRFKIKETTTTLHHIILRLDPLHSCFCCFSSLPSSSPTFPHHAEARLSVPTAGFTLSAASSSSSTAVQTPASGTFQAAAGPYFDLVVEIEEKTAMAPARTPDPSSSPSSPPSSSSPTAFPLLLSRGNGTETQILRHNGNNLLQSEKNSSSSSSGGLAPLVEVTPRWSVAREAAEEDGRRQKQTAAT